MLGFQVILGNFHRVVVVCRTGLWKGWGNNTFTSQTIFFRCNVDTRIKGNKDTKIQRYKDNRIEMQ